MIGMSRGFWLALCCASLGALLRYAWSSIRDNGIELVGIRAKTATTSVVRDTPLSNHQEIFEESGESLGTGNLSIDRASSAINNVVKTVTGPDDEDIDYHLLPLADTRLCRLRPKPVLGKRKQPLENSMFQGMGFNIRYQCAGPSYKKYIRSFLMPYVLRRQRESPWWGRRPSMVPPKGDRSILLVGNSHTKQIAGALFCQYADQFDANATKLYEPYEYGFRMPTVNRLAFSSLGGGMVHVAMVGNHAGVYSSRWKANLEESLGGISLSGFDAIVVGNFNKYDEKWANTELWAGASKYAARSPHREIDLKTHPFGIPLEDLIQEYRGPVIRVSMFSLREQGTFLEDVDFLQKANKINNSRKYRFVNARQHLAEPEFRGGEQCACPPSGLAQDCIPKGKSSYENGHRCQGAEGGEPDLAAFELVEQLWDIFGG